MEARGGEVLNIASQIGARGERCFKCRLDALDEAVDGGQLRQTLGGHARGRRVLAPQGGLRRPLLDGCFVLVDALNPERQSARPAFSRLPNQTDRFFGWFLLRSKRFFSEVKVSEWSNFLAASIAARASAPRSSSARTAARIR